MRGMCSLNYSTPSSYLSYLKKNPLGAFCLPNPFIYSTVWVTKACPADHVKRVQDNSAPVKFDTYILQIRHLGLANSAPDSCKKNFN